MLNVLGSGELGTNVYIKDLNYEKKRSEKISKYIAQNNDQDSE